MGKATGAFLILAGIGTAALVLPSVDTDAERQLADVVRIATGATSSAAMPTPRATPATTSAAVMIPAPVPAARQAQTALMSSSNPIATATIPTAPAIISPVVAATTTLAYSDTSRVDNKDSRAATLARDIQRELKRVGCYDGEVSGDWNSNTRKAMKSFVDRVNATLPTDAPDHILKTLVQGHPGNACGSTCPTGQSLAGDGRCLPSAILAQRDSGLAKKRVAVTQEPLAKARPLRNETRVDAPPETPLVRSAEASSWQTTTIPQPQPLVPLSGRMAIGGPRAELQNAQPSLISPPLTTSAPVKPSHIAAINADDNVRSGRDDDAGNTVRKAAPLPVPRATTGQPRERRALPPPAVVRYAAPSWQAPVRRFGPHIFTDQARWAR
jgi:hypothetical protein